MAEADDGSERRARRRVRLLLSLPFLGLALTGLAARAGVPPTRLRVLAIHLVIACLGVAGNVLTSRAQARRARRQRRLDVPWNVRLRRPIWIKLDGVAIALAVAGLVAALPAAAGLSSISVGVLLTLSVISVATVFGDRLMTPTDLTFEEEGLRLHLGAVSFRVPWETITRVEGIGPKVYRGVNLHIADREALVASIAPPAASARKRVEGILGSRKGAGVSLLMMPWTAGLDGLVVERAIEAARRGEPQRGGALN